MSDAAVLDNLIDAYLDGALSPQSKRRLEAMLCGEPDARDHFWQRVAMHAAIRRVYESRQGSLAAVDSATLTELAQLLAHEDEAVLVELSEAEVARRSVKPRGFSAGASRLPMQDRDDYAFDATPVQHIVIPRWAVYGMMAAALVLLVVLIGPAFQSSTPPSHSPPTIVATLSHQRGAQWQDESIAVGTPLRSGQQLELTSGLIELSMAPGAVVVVEGPAVLRLLDASQVALDRGKLGARITGGQSAFTVTTPTARVIDRGTVFGVEISEAGATSVAVFEGNVELRERSGDGRSARSLLLAAGFSGSVGAQGVLDGRAQPLPADAVVLADAFDRGVTPGRYVEDFEGYALPTTDAFRRAELQMVTLERKLPPQMYGVLERPPGSGNQALVFSAGAQSGWLQGGFFRIDDLNPGQAVTGFTARYRYLIAQGSNGYFTNGFALNFGDFGNQTIDELYNREEVFAETGWRRGLAISVRPYDFPDSRAVERPTIEVRLDGQLVATYDNPETFLHANRWIEVSATWRRGEGLTVHVDGTPVFVNLPVAIEPQPGWRFAFTARQGGIEGHQAIDDIAIETRVTAQKVD